jgi:hypothetical protein
MGGSTQQCEALHFCVGVTGDEQVRGRGGTGSMMGGMVGGVMQDMGGGGGGGNMMKGMMGGMVGGVVGGGGFEV